MVLRLVRSGGGDARNDSPRARSQPLSCRSNISPEIERKIERVLILAEQPVLRRPIAAATVLDALPRACERDAALCEDVRRYLTSLTRTAGISYATLDGERHVGRRYAAAESPRHELAKRLRSRRCGVLAARRLRSRNGRRAGLRRRDDADGDGREHRPRILADRHRLSRSALVAVSRQRDAAQHASRDAAVGDDLELHAVHAREATLRSIHRGDERIHQHRVRRRHDHRRAAARRIALVDRAAARAGRSASGASCNTAAAIAATRSAICSMRFSIPADNDNTGTSEEFGNQVASFTSQFVLGEPVAGRRVLRVRRRGHVHDRATCGSATRRCRPASRFRSSGERSLGDVRAQRSGKTRGTSITSIGDGLRNEGHVLGHWGADWRVLGDGVGARSLFARVELGPALRRRDRGLVSAARQRGLQRRQLRDGDARSTHATAVRGSSCSSARSSRSAATSSANPTRASAPSSVSRASDSMKQHTHSRALAAVADCLPRCRRADARADVFVDFGLHGTHVEADIADAARQRHDARRAVCTWVPGVRRELSERQHRRARRARRRRRRSAARRPRVRLPPAPIGAIRRDGIRRRRTSRPRDARATATTSAAACSSRSCGRAGLSRSTFASATRSRATTCCRASRRGRQARQLLRPVGTQRLLEPPVLSGDQPRACRRAYARSSNATTARAAASARGRPRSPASASSASARAASSSRIGPLEQPRRVDVRASTRWRRRAATSRRARPSPAPPATTMPNSSKRAG